MSGKVVSWAFEQNTGSAAAKAVLVKLADNANESGFCWPSIEKLVAHTELGQSTVYKHLAALEALGLFHSLDHTLGEDGTIIRAYQLHVPGWDEAIPPRRKSKSVIPPRGIEIPPHGKDFPADGKTIPPHGIPYKEEPSFEPSLEPSLEPSGSPPASGPVRLPGFETNDQDKVPPVRPKPSSVVISRADMDAAYDAYNDIAAAHDWPKCQMRSTMRDGHLRKRMQEVGGIEGWLGAMERAGTSDHLCGRSQRSPGYENWKPDIDFFLQAKSFTSLMEGKYDNRTGPQGAGSGGVLASAARVAARRASNGAH